VPDDGQALGRADLDRLDDVAVVQDVRQVAGPAVDVCRDDGAAVGFERLSGSGARCHHTLASAEGDAQFRHGYSSKMVSVADTECYRLCAGAGLLVLHDPLLLAGFRGSGHGTGKAPEKPRPRDRSRGLDVAYVSARSRCAGVAPASSSRIRLPYPAG